MPRISQEEIDNRFDLHPANEETGPKMDRLRAAHKELAELVVEITPQGREQAQSLSDLERSLFHANAAIARQR